MIWAAIKAVFILVLMSLVGVLFAHTSIAGKYTARDPSGSGLVTNRVILPNIDPSAVSIEIGHNVQISVSRSHWMHTEMHIAADPLNYRKLIACSISDSSELSPLGERDIVYGSDDQGLTWSPEVSVGNDASDPTCAYTSQGTALFEAVRTGASGGRIYGASEIYASADGGLSWIRAADVAPLDNSSFTTGVATSGTHTVWIGGMDLQGNDGRGPCFGDSPLVATNSMDSGRHFSNPMTLMHGLKGYCLAQAGGAATFSDGTPVYSVLEIRQPWLHSVNLPGKPNATLAMARIDRGGIFVSQIPDVYSNWTALWTTSKAALAIDISKRSPYHNRMYAAWSDWRTGRCEILLSFSDDRGATWATPRIISADHPFGDGHFGPDDTQAMLAVNGDGVVAVAWYSRASSEDDLAWTVRFRASLDGGITWLPSVQVSSQANTFGVPTNWSNNFSIWHLSPGVILIMPGYHAFQFFTGGDYSGMTADAAGVFHPVWCDDRTGVSQMWTAQVRVSGRVRRTARNPDEVTYVLPTEDQLPPVPEYSQYPHGTQEPDTVPDASELSGAGYNPATQEFSFSIRLRNDSRHSMRGPWKLYVEGVQSSYGQVGVISSDSAGIEAEGQWAFFAGHDNVLRPGQSTESRRVFVRLSHERPFSVTDFWVPVRLPLELASIRYKIESSPN